jgi:peptidoglycan/LPS O-acetylase OafA/YrhL
MADLETITSQGTANSPPNVPAWTVLRFFASFWILLFHFGQDILPFPIHAGIPVSFFFFLSGFVLTYSFRYRHVTRVRFLIERWARLGPLYWLALIGSFLLCCPFQTLDRLTLLPWIVRLEVNALGIHTWIPDFALSLNPQSWAVSVELTLYILFLCIGPWIFRMSKRHRWTSFWCLWIVGMSLLCFARGWVWDRWFYENNSSLRYVHHFLLYHPTMYVPVFTLGMLAAPDSKGNSTMSMPVLSFLLAVAGITIAVVPQSSVWRYFLHMGGLAPLYALLLHALRRPTPIVKFLSTRWLVLLGTSSYAVYIFQHPLSRVFSLVFSAWKQSILGFSMFVVVLVCFAVFLNRYVETPLRKRMLTTLTFTQSEAS